MFNRLKTVFTERIGVYNKQKSSLLDTIVFIIIMLVAVIIIRRYIITPFIVNGSSMVPTFHHNDYLIVDRFSMLISNPQRLDVIVFQYPNDTSKYFIKRVIGLPGDRVIIKNGFVTVFNTENPDGIPIPPPDYDIETEGTIDVTLSEKEYFVLGDNRPKSSDSRFWGALERDYIVGEPLIRLFPIVDISIFPGRISL